MGPQRLILKFERKDNLNDTKELFTKWRDHEGLVIGGWYGQPAPTTKNDIERFTFHLHL